jgi:hydroxyacylglutathione hydrolase
MYTEILPDVYDITVQNDGTARYRTFLVDIEGPTLIDAGLPDTTETLFEAIDKIGIEPERVVITHDDVDHAGGLEAVRDCYPARTFVPAGADVEDALVDERYGDGDEIGPFEAVYTPGHASEHYVLGAEEDDFAVLGDAVFGADARGLPEGYFVLPTAFFSADLAAADETLERLLEYEFDAGLVFHGSSVLSDASDKLASFVEFAGKP